MRLRTRYFDDRLDEQLDSGCRQVVIPGAGLDTRAVRKQVSGVTTLLSLRDNLCRHFCEVVRQTRRIEVRILGVHQTTKFVEICLRTAGIVSRRAGKSLAKSPADGIFGKDRFSVHTGYHVTLA